MTKASRGICAVCAGEFVVTKAGGMRAHLGNVWDGRFRQICEGGGKPPAYMTPDPITEAVAAAEARGRQWAIDTLQVAAFKSLQDAPRESAAYGHARQLLLASLRDLGESS